MYICILDADRELQFQRKRQMFVLLRTDVIVNDMIFFLQEIPEISAADEITFYRGIICGDDHCIKCLINVWLNLIIITLLDEKRSILPF